MKKFSTRAYSVADFLEWHSNDLLELSPDFQRRSVWSQKAKSYLIDTMIRGKPIPKILITQKLSGRRTARTVVDGQQRLRSIMEFVNGDFKISRAHNKQFAGLTFETLPDHVQEEFLEYELGVDLLFNLPYEDLLDIFARINSYTVILKKQEKLNAKYLGYFKHYAFEYGRKYVKYFIEGNILTKAKVTRMAEAELASDLFVALVGGVQTSKNVEQFYKKYEDELGHLDQVAKRFDSIMSYVGEVYPPEDIALTIWSRTPLFYTLFTAIGHCLYGLEGLEEKLRVPITTKSIGKLRVCLDEISARYEDFASDLKSDSIPKGYRQFIDYSRRRTADTASRIQRTNFVCAQLKSAMR